MHFRPQFFDNADDTATPVYRVDSEVRVMSLQRIRKGSGKELVGQRIPTTCAVTLLCERGRSIPGGRPTP
jgi:hypothetical protein